MRIYKNVEVEVEIDLDDFDDDDLVDELEVRGYTVLKNEDDGKIDIQDVIDWYKRGNVKEALVKLEQMFPELYNISEKVK
jgi:hypothetical protein